MRPYDFSAGSPLSVLEAIMPKCKALALFESVSRIVESIYMKPEECEVSFDSVEKKAFFTYTNYDGAEQSVCIKYDFVGRHITIKSIKFK